MPVMTLNVCVVLHVMLLWACIIHPCLAPAVTCRLRLSVPTSSGTMAVLVEAMEVLPGTHIVDLQKVRGNTGKQLGPWAVARLALPASSACLPTIRCLLTTLTCS